MYILLSIVGVVFAILQIILFFKLWGMTNNVYKMANDLRDIKSMYLGNKQKKDETNTEDVSYPENIKELDNEQCNNERPTALYVLAILGIILFIGIVISYITK